MDGTMPEEGFQGQDILMILIEMSREGMAETMTGKAMRPAELLFRQVDMTAQEFGSNGFGRIPASREEIPHGPAVNTPVM